MIRFRREPHYFLGFTRFARFIPLDGPPLIGKPQFAMRLSQIHSHAYPHEHPHRDTSALADDLLAGLFWSTLMIVAVIAIWTVGKLIVRARKNEATLYHR